MTRFNKRPYRAFSLIPLRTVVVGSYLPEAVIL